MVVETYVISLGFCNLVIVVVWLHFAFCLPLISLAFLQLSYTIELSTTFSAWPLSWCLVITEFLFSIDCMPSFKPQNWQSVIGISVEATRFYCTWLQIWLTTGTHIRSALCVFKFNKACDICSSLMQLTSLSNWSCGCVVTLRGRCT